MNLLQLRKPRQLEPFETTQVCLRHPYGAVRYNAGDAEDEHWSGPMAKSQPGDPHPSQTQ